MLGLASRFDFKLLILCLVAEGLGSRFDGRELVATLGSCLDTTGFVDGLGSRLFTFITGLLSLLVILTFLDGLESLLLICTFMAGLESLLDTGAVCVLGLGFLLALLPFLVMDVCRLMGEGSRFGTIDFTP